MKYPQNIVRLLWLLGQKSWRPTELHETVAAIKRSGEIIRVVYEHYTTDDTYRVVEVVLENVVIRIMLPRGIKHADGTFTPIAPAVCRPDLTLSQYETSSRLFAALLEHRDQR